MSLLRILFACLLLLLIWCEAAFAGQVTAFIYHRFNEDRYPSTNISAETIRAQLKIVKETDYQVILLGEVSRRLAAGEPLPERAVSFSVDDAFTSFAEVGWPIFQDYEVPVTLFVNTDAVGTPGYLDWSELNELAQQGVEIASHSSTHAYLVERKPGESFERWRSRVRQDIQGAQQLLEDKLGKLPKIFAYPYGEYTPELVEIVKDLGFTAAFAQQSGVIHAQSPRFYLPRFPMGGPYATVDGFRDKLGMRPLRVGAVEPVNPVMTSNPPHLTLKIVDRQADLRHINCFAQGASQCRVEPVAGKPDWFAVTADAPLTGRRNKYTLTAQGDGGAWHWYSHLWIKSAETE